MSNAEAVLPSNALLSGQPYYPLMLSSSSGTGVSGTDAELSYEDGTLSVPRIIPTEQITNNVFPKIPLTSTWVAYGDSFTDSGLSPAWSPLWNQYLSAKTGTTMIDKALQGMTTPFISGTDYSNDAVKNSAYADYTSIVMIGFNDVFSFSTGGTYTQFNDSYNSLHTMTVLANTLTLSLPQSKIQDPRDASWTKSGVWANNTRYSYGLTTGTANAFIEKNIGASRYVAVRLFYTDSVNYNYQIFINGVRQSSIAWTSPVVYLGNQAPYTTQKNTSIAQIFDLGAVTSPCVVKIQSINAGTATDFGVDFVAGWTDDDLVNARPVLLVSIPDTRVQMNNINCHANRLLKNEAMEFVAKECRMAGIPVSYYKLSRDASCITHTDNFHPSTRQSEMWADEFIKNALIV